MQNDLKKLAESQYARILIKYDTSLKSILRVISPLLPPFAQNHAAHPLKSVARFLSSVAC